MWLFKLLLLLSLIASWLPLESKSQELNLGNEYYSQTEEAEEEEENEELAA